MRRIASVRLWVYWLGLLALGAAADCWLQGCLVLMRVD